MKRLIIPIFMILTLFCIPTLVQAASWYEKAEATTSATDYDYVVSQESANTTSAGKTLSAAEVELFERSIADRADKITELKETTDFTSADTINLAAAPEEPQEEPQEEPVAEEPPPETPDADAGGMR